MAAQSLIRHNWLLCLCLEEGRQPDVFLGTAGDDWCPYCTSSVKNIRDPRLILYLVFCPFSSSLQLPELQEGSKARRIWQLSRSKSIDRHVSHNSAITIHCSSLEHVDNMNSWCQIPSIAPDGCDAIDLAELGRPNTAIITTRDLNLDRVNDCKKEKWGGGQSVRKISQSRRLPEVTSSYILHPQKSPWQCPSRPSINALPACDSTDLTLLIQFRITARCYRKYTPHWFELKHLIPPFMREQKY